MRIIRTWMNNRWAIPATSGVLIVAALLLLQISRNDTAGNILIVAAAIVAGSHVVTTAARELWARVIGIDLLVAVAAVGAAQVNELVAIDVHQDRA